MGYRYSYSDETHANPSPDGKKVVFASDWGAVTGQNTPTSAYVILLPDWDGPATAAGSASALSRRGHARASQSTCEYELIGLDGRTVKRMRGVSVDTRARASGVAAGMYMLRVGGADGRVIRRVFAPGNGR